jgi:hypothetical protein
MAEIQDPLVPGRDDVRLLLEDLACVSGTLSEIMTAWRRVMPGPPELPLSGLTRLQDATRQLTADIGTAASAGLRPDMSVAERLSALSEDIAGIRAATRTPGTSEVVDHGLWELIAAAMRRARAHLTNLMPAGGPGRLRPDGPDIPQQREVAGGLDAESGGGRQVLQQDGVAVPPGRGPGVQGVPPARRAEVCDQQGAARAQHPVDLAERVLARRLMDVVRRERAGHDVDRPVGPGQVLGHSYHE